MCFPPPNLFIIGTDVLRTPTMYPWNSLSPLESSLLSFLLISPRHGSWAKVGRTSFILSQHGPQGRIGHVKLYWATTVLLSAFEASEKNLSYRESLFNMLLKINRHWGLNFLVQTHIKISI